jgi:hypothetical protein
LPENAGHPWVSVVGPRVSDDEPRIAYVNMISKLNGIGFLEPRKRPECNIKMNFRDVDFEYESFEICGTGWPC